MQQPGGYFSAAHPVLEIRHTPSGLNSAFTASGLSIERYVSATREMIRMARETAQPGFPDEALIYKIVEGNAPFALEPAGDNVAGKTRKYRRGILLTHGLTDSPYFMRHLAAFFQAQGFRVLSILLPGHGTRPGDLLDVRWREWARAVAWGSDRLAEEADEIFLCGYSAGAALSLYQSLQDKRILGLFLFAPAMDINRKAAFANLHKLTSWLMPRKKWLEIKPDRDYYKYESFAKNNAAQMYYLISRLHAMLQRQSLAIPVFVAASEDDKTVNIAATISLMDRLINPENELIVYTADTVKLAHHPVQGRTHWVSSLFPEQKVLSSAHTGILVSPDDPHYGMHGEYANCIHYYPAEMEKYLACMQRPQECWLGEINEKNLQAGLLRRLMYNPNFEQLEDAMRNFLEKI